jgi:hypothetical protein
MTDAAGKALHPAPDPAPETGDFGKPERRPLCDAEARTSDRAEGADVTSGGRLKGKPEGRATARKRPQDRSVRSKPGSAGRAGLPKGARKALSHDALDSARKLKRDHRPVYDADPKKFRKVIARAQARVFRLKPGPKADPRIAQAASERRRGAGWKELCEKFIEHYREMSEFTRDLAETGFRRKVNRCLQRHPSLRRRRQTGTRVRRQKR